MTKELKLSIMLMTSNRKDTIRKCLDSLKQLRNTIPSELVIVDTGCDEEMRGIIEEYTDRIVKFTWCNDFAAARNAGIAACTGNWFMFLDDDEWFEDTKEIEDFFLSGDCNRYGEATYIQRNYGKKDGSIFQDAYVKRIIRLDEHTHFEGRIHEVLCPQYAERTRLQSYVHHYGYAFDDQESNVRHSYRNIVLLRDGIKDEPENMHWRVQLALEYIAVQEYSSLWELCRESIRLLEKREGQSAAVYRGSFCDGLVYALFQMEQYEEAGAKGAEYLQNHSNSKLAQMYLFRWMAEIYVKLGRVDAAGRMIHEYLQLEAEFVRDPDAFWEDDMIISRSAVDDQYRERMHELMTLLENDVLPAQEPLPTDLSARYDCLWKLEEQLEERPRQVEVCFELASQYYYLNENSKLEILARGCLEFVTDELRQLFICFYVDALFSECRYDKVVEVIETYGEDNSLSDVAMGLLFCESCISMHRLQRQNEALAYGKAYLERFMKYQGMWEDMPPVIGAAYRLSSYELVREFLQK